MSLVSFFRRLFAVTWLAVGIYCDETVTFNTWSVSQDDLSCSTPQRRFAINDTGHDAILITLRSDPTLDKLICNDDLDLRISFGEQGVFGPQLCPDKIREQLTFYTTSLSIVVTRSALHCTASKAFHLSVEYALLHCWNAAVRTLHGNESLHLTYPCGRVHIVDLHVSSHYLSKEVFTDMGEYVLYSIERTLNDSLTFTWSSWRAPATEMDLRFSKSIRLVVHPSSHTHFPFPDNLSLTPLCTILSITFDLSPSNHSIRLCDVNDFFAVSEAVDLVRTRLVLTLRDMQAQGDVLGYLSTYSIVIDIRFGPRGYSDLSGEQWEGALPFQLWQSDLELQARFLFDGVPFLDTWLYRLYVDVPPGRQIHVRWSPLDQQDHALSFWDSMNKDSEESSDGPFQASLGAYQSGEARSINNRMVMEVAVTIAHWQQPRASRERAALTVVYLHSTAMENECDETEDSNVTVIRQILENTETFAAIKAGMEPMEQFNCRLTFRTQTEDAVFLARMWLLTADACRHSTYYVVFGEGRGRHVQPCLDVMKTVTAGDSLTGVFTFVLSDVVSLVAYLRQSATDDDVTGIAGQFTTTCPPTTNGTCQWSNGTLDSRLDNGTAQNIVFCDYILSTQLTASLAGSGFINMVDVACLFTLTAAESSWQQHAFAQPNEVGLIHGQYGTILTQLVDTTSTLLILLEGKQTFVYSSVSLNNPDSFCAIYVVGNFSAPLKGGSSSLFLRSDPTDTVTPADVAHYALTEGGLERVFYTTHPSFIIYVGVSTWLSFMMEFNAVPRAPFFPHGRACPTSFRHLGDHCYNVSVLSDGVSWEQAREGCVQRGATLLTIADKGEADVVLRALEPFVDVYLDSVWNGGLNSQPAIYVGLRRVNGSFRWDDAAVPLGFEAWYHPSDFDALSPIFWPLLALDDNVSQPTDGNGDCVLMAPLSPEEPRLNWAVIPCGRAFPNSTLLLVCMIRNEVSEATNVSWPKTFCPAGWIKVGDKCEKLVSAVNMTAEDAQVRCREASSAVAAFNYPLHSLLFRLLMAQRRDSAKWMNDTERGQLTAYGLLTGLRRSLVPLSEPVTGGVICERNAQIQVNVQHGFEVPCASGVFVSFTRGCGHGTCDDNSTDSGCVHEPHVPSSRSSLTRQALWAVDSEGSCEEQVAVEPLVEATGGWIELNTTARKEHVMMTGNKTCGEESVSCARSETECTRQSAICIYGVPGCSDGSHLLDCESFECPLLFKCPQSYCIHLDRVGDGTNDCPHGHDEMLGERICAGLFRCGTRCFPLGFVCDHVLHCEEGEDELFCPRPPDDYCPPGCTCQDVRVTCQSFNTSLHVPSVTESVDLSGGNLSTFSSLDLTIARRLLLLNLSSNLLSTIPRNAFLCLRSLLHLDLSHNRLKSLQLGAFEGLLALRSVSLTGNRVTTVEPFAFAPLQNVTQLDLSEMHITAIPWNAFSGMQKLERLSLTGNPIAMLEKGAFGGLPALTAMDMLRCNISQFDAEIFDENSHLEVFLSDVEQLCCTPSSVTRCEPFSPTVKAFCRRLLPVSEWSSIGPTLIVVGTVGCLASIVWMLVGEKKNKYRGLMTVLFLNHMLVGLAASLLIVADNQFGKEFFVFSRAWPKSATCLAAGMLIVIGCLGSSGTLSVLLATYLSQFKRVVLLGSLLAVMGTQLSVLLPWLVVGVDFYAHLPACVPLLLLHHEWWLLSLLWMLCIVVLPQPFTWTAMSRVRSEWAQLKQFNLRSLDRLLAKLDLLRALLVCLSLAVSNLAVGTLWLLEAFSLIGERQPGHLWSTVTLLVLHFVLQPLVFGLSVALAKRYRRRNL